MNKTEIEQTISELRSILPPKVDYAELVGSPVPSSYGIHYVWDDPEPYIIEKAVNLIKELQERSEKLFNDIKVALELIEDESERHRRQTENVHFHGGILYALGYARGVLPDLDKINGEF